MRMEKKILLSQRALNWFKLVVSVMLKADISSSLFNHIERAQIKQFLDFYHDFIQQLERRTLIEGSTPCPRIRDLHYGWTDTKTFLAEYIWKGKSRECMAYEIMDVVVAVIGALEATKQLQVSSGVQANNNDFFQSVAGLLDLELQRIPESDVNLDGRPICRISNIEFGEYRGYYPNSWTDVRVSRAFRRHPTSLFLRPEGTLVSEAVDRFISNRVTFSMTSSSRDQLRDSIVKAYQAIAAALLGSPETNGDFTISRNDGDSFLPITEVLEEWINPWIDTESSTANLASHPCSLFLVASSRSKSSCPILVKTSELACIEELSDRFHTEPHVPKGAQPPPAEPLTELRAIGYELHFFSTNPAKPGVARRLFTVRATGTGLIGFERLFREDHVLGWRREADPRVIDRHSMQYFDQLHPWPATGSPEGLALTFS